MTQDYLKEIFDYNDGYLIWKIQKSRGDKGKKAGGICSTTGRRTIGLLGKRWVAHRLIFFYHNGFMPDFIDHIDRDKLNNRIENLRATTKSQNGANRGKTKKILQDLRGYLLKNLVGNG